MISLNLEQEPDDRTEQRGSMPVIAYCIRKVRSGAGRERSLDVFAAERGYQLNHVLARPWRPEDGEVLFINCSANWYPEAIKSVAKLPKAERPFVALLQSEPLPPPRSSGYRWPPLKLREITKILLRDIRVTDVYSNYFAIRRLHRQGVLDLVVTSTRGRADFLKEKGIEAEYIPMGWRPDHGRDLGLKRDIDVLFLGEYRMLRRWWAVQKLRLAGIDVMMCGQWGNPKYFYENRVKLINRSKIFLNIPRFAGEFAGLRFIIGLVNKALIVSEPLYNSYPFVAGEHYVSATRREMPDVIRYYLSHEDEREEIAERGRQLVLKRLRYDDCMEKFFNLIRQRVHEERGV